MTQISSETLQKVGKGTTEKTSLQKIARKKLIGHGADATWGGWLVVRSRLGMIPMTGNRGSGDRKSSVADRRQLCTTDDQWRWQR